MSGDVGALWCDLDESVVAVWVPKAERPAGWHGLVCARCRRPVHFPPNGGAERVPRHFREAANCGPE